MPLAIDESPITDITSLIGLPSFLASKKPACAEIELELCPDSQQSYFDSS